MKTLFLETRKKFTDIDFTPLNNLEGQTISLAATIQYLDLIPQIKEYLEKQNKTIILKQGSFHQAQVLGCQSQAFDKTADTLLLITDGKFHAINNAIQLNKEITIFNTKTLEKIIFKDIKREQEKIKGKQNKFISYNIVGILTSTKQHQKYNNIEELKQKLENKGKTTYIFESETLNLNELENFPQIQIWVNTACPGLARDHNKIINLSDIQEFL